MALVSIDWNPTPRHLRQFALVGAACLLTIAALAVSRQGGGSAGPWCFAALGAGLGAVGVLRPRWVP